MKYYIQFTFDPISEKEQEILIAQLSQIGFEGFEQAENKLVAHILEPHLDEDDLMEVLNLPHWDHLKYSRTDLEQKNWNAIWESLFEPITISGQLHIRASFHPKSLCPMELVIDPEMSFGTGHHPTTSQVLEGLLKDDLKGKKVLDVGCGTGILAMAASLCGAERVIGIDNDPQCLKTSKTNLELNSINGVEIYEMELPELTETEFDFVYANINKNTILSILTVLVDKLKPTGRLTLSGILSSDAEEMTTAAKQNDLLLIDKKERDNWCALTFAKA